MSLWMIVILTESGGWCDAAEATSTGRAGVDPDSPNNVYSNAYFERQTCHTPVIFFDFTKIPLPAHGDAREIHSTRDDL